MLSVLKVTEDIIPPKIPAELVNEITNKLITENDMNATILFSNKIVKNPESKPQWNKNDNPLLPINPDTWENIQKKQELNDVRKSLQDKLENEIIPKIFNQIIPNYDELKDTKKNDESTTPPKK